MVILFIGPSGSGKDTQAQLLKEALNFDIVSSGNLLRDISDGETNMQIAIQKSLNEGFLPDHLVYSLLQIYLEQSHLKHFILTGFVRRTSQISLLDSALLDIGEKLDRVVYFSLNDEEAIKRMQGRLIDKKTGKIYHQDFNPPPKEILDNLVKRPDDRTVDSYLKRLKEFHKDNTDIINEYKARGILINIPASGDINQIHEDLKKQLKL